MDPFLITVGIVGLLNVATQTLTLAKTYVDEVKHGKEAAVEFMNELDVLHSNISRLDRLLKSESEATRHFENTSVLVSSTHACRNKLNVLYDKLHGHGRSRLSRLKWPLNVEDHRETIGELRAFAQWTQFALTIDGCGLLSKTSIEVLEVLRKQLETFQLLEKVDDRTCSIEQSIKEQAQSLNDDRMAAERNKVLDWLSARSHEQKHHNVRMPRVDGTGEWLLHDIRYERWRDEQKMSNNVLCCDGVPGSGKSVLAYEPCFSHPSSPANIDICRSLVIDQLTDTVIHKNKAIVHFYYDYREHDEQSAGDMFASLLKQLLLHKSELPASVIQLYQRLTSQSRKPQQ